MPGKLASSRKLLNRSMSLLKGVSGHLQREALRAVRRSGLRVRIAALKRERAAALRSLGEQVQRDLKAHSLKTENLLAMSGKITDLEGQIETAEREVAELIAASRGRREASRDKSPRTSRRLEIVADRGVDRLLPATAGDAGEDGPDLPLRPIDPLEDILGTEAGGAGGEGLKDASAGGRNGH